MVTPLGGAILTQFKGTVLTFEVGMDLTAQSWSHYPEIIVDGRLHGPHR